MNARPIIWWRVIGPQMRESSELSRLSPIMKYRSFGTWIGPNLRCVLDTYGSLSVTQPWPAAPVRVAEAIPEARGEHTIADLEGAHHRRRRDPVGLDDPALHRPREHEGG